jgi:uncharacterized membrane protein YcaP (DUF421 family)
MPRARYVLVLERRNVEMDWKDMFLPQHALEVIVRGSIMYLALFTLIRVVIRRRIGSLAPADLLVVVLLADAAQNGMAGHYDSVPDGIVLCATIVFWATALDWLGFRWRRWRRILEPEPLELVRGGRFQYANMKREMLHEHDVLSLLRQNGVSEIADVATAYLEPDGHFSVLRADGKSSPQSTEPQPGA